MRISQLAISALIILSLIQPVFAQNIAQNFPQFPFGTWYSPEALATFLGVPSDWLGIPKVIYYVIVPFIVAVTVTYGILTELRIFRSPGKGNKINVLLAVTMSFLLMPSGILTVIVTYFYAGGVLFGLLAFGFLFVVGIAIWTYGTTFRMWGTHGSARGLARDVHQLNRDIHHLDTQIENLRRSSNQPGANIQEINQQMRDLQNRRADLLAQRAAIQQQLQTI